MRAKLLLAAVAALGLIGAATAPPPAPAMPAAGPGGYLGDMAPDTYRILPPAPVAGSTRYQADRTTYLETRRLQDTPRWKMAQGDVDQGGLVKSLSCALGVTLTRDNAPRTAALLAKAGVDVSRATNRPKDIYRRQRPYLIDEGPTCIERSAALSASPDYPSGHNAWGWTVGLILAELAPDRATEILARARAFGEGRLVCGVHNLSAVEAGRLNASIVVAALHGQAAFRTDLDAARQEVAAARKAGPAPDPAACAAEAEIVAKSPY
ncbi:phosphatase PAP2 family protein [Phenylobacterium sp.]|uniref:acid phosphatase n=1 Tax=Phenylobacterium sp. TaxID=1871053 RepID=UPI0025FD7499|nr:phosphatase PAP2 family protein [Phenylobacterium sp.]